MLQNLYLEMVQSTKLQVSIQFHPNKLLKQISVKVTVTVTEPKRSTQSGGRDFYSQKHEI